MNTAFGPPLVESPDQPGTLWEAEAPAQPPTTGEAGPPSQPGSRRRRIDSRSRPVTQIERDYSAEERLISETDLKGFITMANASFCTVSGYAYEELMGQRHNIVRHPDVPREVFADLWRTIQAGHRWTGLVKNRCKNGDHYWVRAFVSPIIRDGQIVGYRSVRVKPTREEIRQAEELYEKVNRGEVKPDTLAEIRRREPWIERFYFGRLPVARQIGLMLLWPFLWFAAALAAMHGGAAPALIWGMFGFAAATTLAAGVLVIDQFAGPLRKLQSVAGALESGNLSVRIDARGRSDLSRTLREVDLALDGVELLLSEMAQVFSGLARGELGRRVLITLPGELERIKQSVNAAADQIETTINELSARLSELAEGRIHAQNGVKVSGAGTFREAQARAIAAAQRLSSLFAEIMETTRALSRGDLTHSITAEAVGDLRELQQNVDQALANLRDAMAAVRESSDSVARGAVEVAAASEEIARGAQEQTEAVERMQAAIHEIMAVVAQAGEDALEAGRRSQEAVALVREGRVKMRNMVELTSAIERSSHEIAGITRLIEEVAEQTNLLALNAAIEAARAGHEGRGFSVVAEEVRRLAVRAAESTGKIRGLVDNTLTWVRQADTGAGEVDAMMESIEQSVQSADAMLRQVNQVLQQQQASLERVGGHTSSLFQIAQNNAAVTQQLAASAEGLRTSAAEMQARMERFRLR
ncbi:MAG: hypothetical protein BAA04_12770 [Firmicutes bacterium ZCTH02-B6]|nr:MAG: hypothetical protein BAA04_12770 [Firmicutes bacterium ZCTH02-B6]